jgi:hypothetical protein
MRDVIHRFINAEEDDSASALDAGCATHIPRPPAYQWPALPAPALK